MKKLAAYALIGLTATALVGCFGDDDDDNEGSSNTTLEGTAATGAAIANETITAKCSDGSGFLSTVTTDANGEWEGEVANGVLPCALKISSSVLGSSLYSFAETSGTVNITPLTNMVIARATSMSPDDWFGGASIVIDETAFDNAMSSLTSSLTSAGFTLPAGDPITTDFDIGDDWDQVLDDFMASIDGSSAFASYAALLTTFLEGTDTLPSFVDASGGDSGGVDSGSGDSDSGGGDSGGGDSDSGGGTSGNYNLQITTTVSNLGSPVVTTLEDVPKPETQSAFCSADQYEQFQNSAEGVDYTWEIVSCSFSGNEGNITAKASFTVSGFSTSLDYTVNYLYIAQ